MEVSHRSQPWKASRADHDPYSKCRWSRSLWHRIFAGVCLQILSLEDELSEEILALTDKMHMQYVVSWFEYGYVLVMASHINHRCAMRKSISIVICSAEEDGRLRVARKSSEARHELPNCFGDFVKAYCGVMKS